MIKYFDEPFLCPSVARGCALGSELHQHGPLFLVEGTPRVIIPKFAPPSWALPNVWSARVCGRAATECESITYSHLIFGASSPLGRAEPEEEGINSRLLVIRAVFVAGGVRRKVIRVVVWRGYWRVAWRCWRIICCW